MIAVRMRDPQHHLFNRFGHALYRRGYTGEVLAVFFIELDLTNTFKIRCISHYKHLGLNTSQYITLENRLVYD